MQVMTIQLTEDQSKAIEQAPEATPLAVDPRTRRTYQLVSVEDGISDTYRAQIDSAMRAGWNDPAMDDYNDYDAHRKP